jgi:hypothetical protein
MDDENDEDNAASGKPAPQAMNILATRGTRVRWWLISWCPARASPTN